MPKVTMLQTTRADGVAYLAGTVCEVSDDVAARWVELKIAEAGATVKEGEPTAHASLQQSVADQDLEIAALHGDVAAARKLDAAKAAAPPPKAAAKEPEKAEKPAATTGESARASLAPSRAQRA